MSDTRRVLIWRSEMMWPDQSEGSRCPDIVVFTGSWHHISQLLITHYPTSAHTHALAAPHYVDIDHRNICCVRIRFSTPESQHPSVIIFSMGSKYLPSPAWCRVIIKNLISGPGDNTSGRHVAHVAPHYNRSLQSANRNARFFSK